jgi:hypothetical protein
MAETRPVDYASLLYAYALGCLDKEDLKQLLEFLESGKEYPWQELGEYQNLASLLPSFLNIEEPPAQLKDRVARTLYRLREAKPPAKTQSRIIPPPPSSLSKTKTSLKEKMRATSVDAPAPVKTFAPPESDEIVAPADFKSFSPFSQRAGVGARPQQDTQVRSRAAQQTVDRQAFGGDQDRPESAMPQDEVEARFLASAPEEFILNQTIATPAPEPDQSFHLHMEPEAVPEHEIAAQPVFGDLSPVDEEPQQFEFNLTDEKPQPVENAAAKLEEIRKKVVADVEKEAAVEPVETEEKPRYAPPLILYIMPILIILGVAVVYYLLNTKIKALQNGPATTGQFVTKEEYDKLKENVAPRWSAEVLSLLLKKDAKVVLLSGSGKYIGSYGKIILDSKTGEGFLALGYLPLPPQDTRYHVWLLEGKAVTHIDFKEIPAFSQDAVTYTPLGKIPALKGKKEIFLVTVEKSGATPAQPSQQRCLEGNAQ